MILNLLILIVVLLLLVVAISKWKIHPFIALLLAGITLGFAVGFDGVKTVSVLLDGFSNTLKWIAIVVILGAFIGEVLNASGGGIRISEKILKLTGQKRLPWAMGFTGYLVSIPVFVDVAYILLHPIIEALSKRSKTPVLVVGLSLAAGLTVSHTLMPPTPGPLAVAALLKADIGRLLLINAFVAVFAVVGGVLWAKLFCKKYRLPFDDKPESTEQLLTAEQQQSKRKRSVLIDLAPIIVPIVLMGIGVFFKSKTPLGKFFEFISIPMIAVLIGAAIAAVDYARNYDKAKLNSLVESAIIKSALVIMITGAGGAFGGIIKASGMQEALGLYFSDMPFVGFLLPFLIAAILTTATGSITVSLIGTASILGEFSSVMPYSPEIMAALIGCGSFCVFHANASFFWLLNRLHNVSVQTLYKTYTLQSLIMGVFGLLGVLILYLIGIK